MAAPLFVAIGAANGGTGSVTYAYPEPFNGGEFLIAIIEDANEAVAATPSGWTLLSGTPVGTGTAASTAATAIRAYYKFAAFGDTPTVAVADLGDHQVGAIFAFEGVDRTTPIDVAAVTSTAASSTSATFPSITTATNDARIICLVANATDTTTAQGSSFSHAGLAGVTSGTFNRADGNGGGISYLTGTLATAGATGTGSCTLATASVKALLTIALRTNQETVATATKLNSYAVAGASKTAVTASKLNAYAVTGALPLEVTITKLVAYAVIGPSTVNARPQVFVCT